MIYCPIQQIYCKELILKTHWQHCEQMNTQVLVKK